MRQLVDLNGDGRDDIVFTDASGTLATWTLDGELITGGATLGDPGGDWQLFV